MKITMIIFLCIFAFCKYTHFEQEKVILKSLPVPSFSCVEIVAEGTKRDFFEQNIFVLENSKG